VRGAIQSLHTTLRLKGKTVMKTAMETGFTQENEHSEVVFNAIKPTQSRM
jgi:hypothetical protein